MSTKMVQIRDVESSIVDVLKARAAAKGMSLSDYLRLEIESIAARPDMDEVLTRIAERPRRRLGIDVVDVVRDVRDEYEPR